MFVLTEDARHSLKQAISKENITDLNEHKFLSEAFELVMASKKETDFKSFTERCEWMSGTLIPGVSIFANALLNNPNFSNIKMELCPDGKLLINNVSILGNTKTFIMMYLILILSINDAVSFDTGVVAADDSNDRLILVQQTYVLYKEMLRLTGLYNTVYCFDIDMIDTFKNGFLLKNIGGGIPMAVATLAMLLLLDIDFCDSNATILLLLSRATKCLKDSMGSYLYAFISSAGEYLGAHTSYLASAVYNTITNNSALSLNTTVHQDGININL